MLCTQLTGCLLPIAGFSRRRITVIIGKGRSFETGKDINRRMTPNNLLTCSYP